MKSLLIPSLTLVLLSACGPASANTADQIYADNCIACHGNAAELGSAPSLFDDEWAYGAEDAVIRFHIEKGIADVGMPSFEGAFSDQELDNLVTYLKAGGPDTLSGTDLVAAPSPMHQTADAVLTAPVEEVDSLESSVKVELISKVKRAVGFVFLSTEDLLVTEKKGRFLYISASSEPVEVKGIPAVINGGQGGLMDVALDPKYTENKWVYLTYSHPLSGTSGTSGPSMTKFIRGRIENFKWVDEEVLFEAKPEHYIDSRRHYGSRITFDDKGHVYFSVGDRGDKSAAQDIDLPYGKIHRLNKDGSMPDDNPFVSKTYPSVYSYGNRNPQGLVWHSDTNVLWETEHGPRGGDELNVIKPAKNYGWPVISYGINYNGTELTPFKAKPGMEQPVSQWTPSIAACGLDIYTGDLFPEWKGRLLAGSLAHQSLRLIEVSGEQYLGEAEILNDKGRIRDVTTGPDGAIYVALPDKIVRLSPK